MSGGTGGTGAALAQTGAPQRKVIAATGGAAVGSAIALILTWILNDLMTKAGIPILDNIQSAFNAIFATIWAFAFGYYTSLGLNETVIPGPDGNPVAATK